jgi:heme exporter protein A
MITALTIDGLALARGGRVLFEGLNLALAAGEAVALAGPNGSGKTSLLRAIAGFLRPAAGSVGFAGADGPLDPEEARGRGLHLLGHQDGLKPGRTAIEELTFQTVWTGGTRDSALEALGAMELGGAAALEVRMLSAGQRRRLALARLIASPRPLWLLDEPMAPLDSARRVRFGEAMAAHLKRGGLILAAVHDDLPIPARKAEIPA